MLGKSSYPCDIIHHYLFQEVSADIMRGVAGASAIVVILAVKVSDVVIDLIEVETEIGSAGRAYQQAGEHIVFARGRFTRIANISALLLCPFPCFPVDNRGVDALENHLIFNSVFVARFVFVGLGVGLEINDVAAVFP